MATGTLNLPIAAATPADGSASNAAPALQVYKGTAGNPQRFGLRAAFDSGTDEHLWWTFIMPQNYASGGTVRLHWATTLTSGNVVWAARVGAITPADADTYLEHAQAAATTATTSVNTTEARRVVVTTISPSVDSAAAGDIIYLLIYRDADNASDTAAGDVELLAVDFEYTTT